MNNEIQNGQIVSGEARQKMIYRAGMVGILVNVGLAAMKAAIGLLSGSVGLISDAVNNATDSGSSLITIIGTRLSDKSADEEHPFGHGRGEYLTSMVIGIIILVTGIESIIHSARAIWNVEELSYSGMTLGLIVVAMLAKVGLAIYNGKIGRKTESDALVASGIDAWNDVLLSAGTLISAILYIGWGINIDAWAGIIISIMVTKSGAGILHEVMNKLLGERINDNLSRLIYQEVNSVPEIEGSYDLILNNYGPDSYIGSINVEIDHEKTVGEMYPILHRLQDRIDEKYHVYIVFGFYAVENGHPEYETVYKVLDRFKKEEKNCLNYHGIYVDMKTKCIYFDITLQYGCNRKALEKKAARMVERAMPGYHTHVTIDTEFSNSSYTKHKLIKRHKR